MGKWGSYIGYRVVVKSNGVHPDRVEIASSKMRVEKLVEEARQNGQGAEVFGTNSDPNGQGGRWELLKKYTPKQGGQQHQGRTV